MYAEGDATKPSARLEVLGMTSGAYAALITPQPGNQDHYHEYTDGYALVSTLTLAKANTLKAVPAAVQTYVRAGACYSCTSATCLTRSAYCHTYEVGAVAADLPADRHHVQLVAAAAYAGFASGGASISGFKALPAGARATITAPIPGTRADGSGSGLTTKACTGCLVAHGAANTGANAGYGQLQAWWYQPLDVDSTNKLADTRGPRFNTGVTVQALILSGTGATTAGTGVTFTLGASSLATGLAGIAAGAAALALY